MRIGSGAVPSEGRAERRSPHDMESGKPLLATPTGFVASLVIGSIAGIVGTVVALVGHAQARLAILATCLVAIFVGTPEKARSIAAQLVSAIESR